MYEMAYQVMAQNCKTQKMIASPFFPHQRADIRVSAKKVSISMVAMILVVANILFSWATGPIRNSVLASATRLPSEYKIANEERLRDIMTVPNRLITTPMMKQARKPLILVLQDKLDASRA